MKKFFGTALFVIGVALAASLVTRFAKEDPLVAKAKKLENLWNTDLANLRISKSLPPAFENIIEVEYKSPDPLLQKVAMRNHPDWSLKKDGKFSLQLFLDELPNENGTFIRYDLVERSSGNTVWELSRTLPLRMSK